MSGSSVGRVLGHAILALAVLTSFVPLIWMVGLSFKPSQTVFANPLNPISVSPTMGNYLEVLVKTDIVRQFFNSIIFAGGVTLGQILIAVPAAYALGRMSFRGANFLFAAF